MERCTASDEILVGSDSSSKKYTVSFREVLPTCTCVSFAIGRNKAKARLDGKRIKDSGNKDAWCKHIDRVYDSACRWRGTTIIPGLCPQCSGSTVPMDESGRSQGSDSALPLSRRPPSNRPKRSHAMPQPALPDPAEPGRSGPRGGEDTDVTAIEASLRAWVQNG